MVSKYDKFMGLVDELTWETESGKCAYVMADGNLNSECLGNLNKEEAVKLAQWILSIYIDPHDFGVSDK